jgi:hypothetical protein
MDKSKPITSSIIKNSLKKDALDIEPKLIKTLPPPTHTTALFCKHFTIKVENGMSIIKCAV